MTAYHGGKQRIGAQIAKTIHSFVTDIENEHGISIKGYCEPFCGMLGVYRHIPELFANHKPKMRYTVGDFHKSVIMMWKAAKNGWKPPTRTTEKQYEKLRKSTDSALKGYIGHQYSFGGQYFSGYSTKYGKNPDSSKASKKIQEIGLILDDTKTTIRHGSYAQYSKLKNYVIYCDPPYTNSFNKYRNEFDFKEFWDWCRDMSENNIVFVSGYSAPKDFEKIYSSKHKLTGIGARKRSKERVENLYVLY